MTRLGSFDIDDIILNVVGGILGFIIFASICCKIITTIAIAIAFPNPPVINVIKIPIPTATIAPIYGIILNNPIVKPIKGAYFTFIISIATVVKIP